MKTYEVQAARDAQRTNYGGESYWDYLEQAGRESHDYWLRRGDATRAEEMLTRSLSEALRGNDGD
jgi:hypothetical protein